MTADFENTLRHYIDDLALARTELEDVVRALRDDDLGSAAGDGWDICQVLHHIVVSEWLYARGITYMRDLPLLETPDAPPPGTVADVLERLNVSRQALLTAADGVGADTFTLEKNVAGNDYSVRWFLEHTADHDREHADQIRAIIRPD